MYYCFLSSFLYIGVSFDVAISLQFPVTLHFSPATNILNENPARTWHLPSYDFQPIHPPTAPLSSLPTSGSRARSLGV